MAEETSWDYHPQQGDEKTAKNRVKSIDWTASEYIDHKQGTGWFSMLALATAVLAALIYLLTRDYFATGTILIVGVIVGTFARKTPRELHYQLSSSGLTIEDKNYPLAHFRSFSIIQEGPVCSLEFTPLKRFMPPVSAYFAAADQKRVMAVLENYLPYEEKGMDGVERLSRRLRF